MPMDLHIAMDVNPEEVFVFALQIVTQVVCVPEDDVCSRPLVDVLQLKFQ